MTSAISNQELKVGDKCLLLFNPWMGKIKHSTCTLLEHVPKGYQQEGIVMKHEAFKVDTRVLAVFSNGIDTKEIKTDLVATCYLMKISGLSLDEQILEAKRSIKDLDTLIPIQKEELKRLKEAQK